MVKNLPANAGDISSITGSGRSPGGGNGNPLWYSCLEKPMDRGACWATVHGLAKSQTRLSNFTFQGYLTTIEKKKMMAYRAFALTSIPPKIPFNDRKKFAF